MDLPISIGRAYDDLANDPRYQHFVRIPDRIIQCIDYFGIACDHAAVRAKLHTYYLFIGIVDDAIDSGRRQPGIGRCPGAYTLNRWVSQVAMSVTTAARSGSRKISW